MDATDDVEDFGGDDAGAAYDLEAPVATTEATTAAAFG
jgi:hypothetical protein